MKLHYVALRKDMFLYMDILYTQIFKWKGILFWRGGRDIVTAQWNKWGVRDVGLWTSGVPHYYQAILTVDVLLFVSDLLY